MRGPGGLTRGLVLAMAMVLLGGSMTPILAYKVKDPKANLDSRVFSRPELRVSSTVELSDHIRSLLSNAETLDGFLAENGTNWAFFVDQRTGRVSLLDGGAIPFIPGAMNGLRFEEFSANCGQNRCIPVDRVENLAREFLSKYQDLFRVNPDQLILDPNGSGPVLDQYYFLRFQWVPGGVPVEGGSVFFRINNGNLLQVATEKIGDLKVETAPSIDLRTAWEVLGGYLAEDAPGDRDSIVEPGRLVLIPATPVGDDPDVYSGRFGQMLEYRLVYKLAFRRPGVQGTWEGAVDAHTGQLLRFADIDRYGHVHGGIRPSDGMPPEENRPFPFADIGGGLYSDTAGNFAGNSATSTLLGKYAHIADACGSISNTTSSGDLNFLVDNAPGTDCVVPAGNPAGLGNTHSSRTLFYNLTAINLKAQIYNPSNTWLTTSFLTANVNGGASCNASSSGSSVNFYKHIEGSCNNLGEVPGVAMHEWAHSYDDNDGVPANSKPLETYADWTAIIQTHNSCTGAGFLIGNNCDGYGDACLDCTGVRDCDYTKHQKNTPWTSANYGTTWSGCDSGSYFGPCGKEDHCESGISTQALWDFVYRDLTGTASTDPMYPNALDITTAWMLEDRLWFAGVITLGDSYTCASMVTNGCGASNLYTVMRALDDDGDGTANGTPHAHAIYHALQRHLIHCNTWNDTSPQNQNQTSCLSLTTPTLSAVAGSNQVTLNWTTGGVNATRYFVYRNESGCDVAFNRIAVVNAPTLTYTDNGVVNATAYYYRVQAVTANDSCVSPSSNCVTVTPQPCAGSISLPKTLYNCADTVDVSVLDSTPGASPWTVAAWSTTDATVKTITLTNNPPGSAIYTGSFTTTTGTAGATQVKVADGATITVRYTDKDYCGTPNTNVDKTVLVDCAGPTVSSVSVSAITDSSAVVSWTTNEASNSRVTYGLATPPGTNRDDLASYVTSHSVTVTGLTSCTKYYFSVTSADVAGNGTTDSNSGTYYSFTTYGRSFVMGPDDVEGGVLSWVASPATGTDIWHQDACKAVSGTKSWKVGKSDAPTCTAQYASSLSNYYLTWNANIGLGSTGHGYHLRFNEWYETESNTGCTYDPIRTQISTDGGTNWTTLATNCGASGGWMARDYDLAAYTGSTVRIRFYFTSDGSANGLGWFVDDINISKAMACGPEMAYQSNTWTDACNGTGSGAGNGFIDAGEDITVHPVLKNTGSQGTTGISATLSTGTAGVTISNATASYPDLAVGSSSACNAPHFAFSVGTGVACGTVIDFTLTITAATGGPWTQNFTMTVGQQVGGTPTTLFTESFDAATFPPTGWTATQVSGTTGAWARVTTSTNPTGIAPHGGAAMAEFNSYHATSGNSTRLARTANISIPAGSASASAVLWVYHETGYTTNADQIQVQTSPDGTTWTNRGTAINRYDGSTGWKQHTVDLAPMIGAGNFRIGYLGASAYGNDTYMDDVSVEYTGIPSCTMSACTPTTCTAPGAPTLASATGTCSGVDLAWTAGTGTTNAYNVYRSSNTTCPVGTLTKVNASPIPSATLTYSDTSAVAGTTYTYIVRGACDAGGTGESANSNCLAATRGAVPAGVPAAPGVSDIAACLGSGVSITWAPVGGATAYDIQVDGGTILSGVTSPYTHIPADSNSHSYGVRARTSCQTTAFSAATAGADVNNGPPSVGTLTMQAIGTDILVSWTPVADPSKVDYYEVMRSLSPAGPFSTSVGTAAGGIHGLFLNLATEPPTAYYKVRAVKGTCVGPME